MHPDCRKVRCLRLHLPRARRRCLRFCRPSRCCRQSHPRWIHMRNPRQDGTYRTIEKRFINPRLRHHPLCYCRDPHSERTRWSGHDTRRIWKSLGEGVDQGCSLPDWAHSSHTPASTTGHGSTAPPFRIIDKPPVGPHWRSESWCRHRNPHRPHQNQRNIYPLACRQTKKKTVGVLIHA